MQIPLEQTQPIRSQYLKIISQILSYGASFSSLSHFNKLLKQDEEFQQMIIESLTTPNVPMSLYAICPRNAPNEGFISTPVLKYFPKDRVGFSCIMWVVFNKINQSNTLFDIVPNPVGVDAIHSPPLIAYKYYITSQPAAGAIQASSEKANSASFKKEDESSLGSSRVNRNEVGKYCIALEMEPSNQQAVKYEIDYPVIQEKTLTHIVISHNKFNHSMFVNGKQIFSGKLINGCELASTKNLRCRVGVPPQGSVLSVVTLLEGAIDANKIANLYSRGPIGDKNCSLKELGIDNNKIYRFPKMKPEIGSSHNESPFEKLILLGGEEAKTEASKGSMVLETNLTKMSIGININSKSMYLNQLKAIDESEFSSPNSKPSVSESFQLSGLNFAYLSNIINLQEFMTNKATLQAIISGINECINSSLAMELKSPQIMRLLKFLTLLNLHNEKCNQLMNELNILKILFSYTNMIPIEIQHAILETIISIMCNDSYSISYLETFTKPPIVSIPIIPSPKLSHYFPYITNIILESKLDHREFMNILLYNLSTRQENFEKFAHEKLLLLIIKWFEDTRKKKLKEKHQLDEGYEKTLELFQLYFYYPHCLDWEIWFSYLLMLKSDETNQDIICDILSLFSVYIFIGSVSNKTFILQESFLASNGLRFLLSLMSYSTVLISEHVIKLLNVLFVTFPKSKAIFMKMVGSEIITKRLQQYEPTFTLLQSLFACVCGNITIESLYPCNNFFVPTVINRSPIADKIIKSIQGTAQNTNTIQNLEIIEVLFGVLSRTKELHYRINLLKQIQVLVRSGGGKN